MPASGGGAASHGQPLLDATRSVDRIVVAHVERHDFLLGDEQLQRDPIRQVDGHGVHARQPPAQGIYFLKP